MPIDICSYYRISIDDQILIIVICCQLQLQLLMDSQNTPGLELRNKYTRDPPSRDNHNDDDYLNKLRELGVQCHPSISPAYFLLKNGLEYPGMKTDKLITKDEILMKVPEKLILSSMKALSQPALHDVYQQDFYKVENCWQDRVLLTYCLFLISSKKSNHIFYEMIQHMSKDIDVAFCWPQQQLNLIKDKTVKNAVQLDIASFEEEWQGFLNIQARHNILQGPQFNRENYKWIFIHITSRCFGKAMDYTSFVPFCEFFNHHSSSVYYEINLNKKMGRKNTQQQDELSSDGSVDSQEYIEEKQFAYQQIESVSYKFGSKECLDLDHHNKCKVIDFANKLLERLEYQISWKDFSIIFAGHFIMKVKIVQNQFIEGRKKYQKTLQSLNSLSQILDKYVINIKKFYSLKYGKRYKYKAQNHQTKDESSKNTFVRPSASKYVPQYTQFYLKTSKNDIFLPNNQVFFCYGHNSNRALLLRYGFAIEGNKYQHFWLSYSIADNLKEVSVLFDRVMSLGLSIRRKFKINYTRLNLDLITFFRLKNWSLYNIKSLDQIFLVTNLNQEKLVLDQIVSSLQHYLKAYEQFSDQDLKNKSLNYHLYFVNVYNLQKKRILLRQIQLFQKLTGVLQRLQNGQKMQQACVQLTKAQKYMFTKYLNSIVL